MHRMIFIEVLIFAKRNLLDNNCQQLEKIQHLTKVKFSLVSVRLPSAKTLQITAGFLRSLQAAGSLQTQLL